MKSNLLLATLALLSSAATALAETAVWQVTKGGTTLYLGGTCHLLRPADLPLPPEYDQAYAAASKVYFETDMARATSPEMQQIIMARGLYDPGQTLGFAVNADAWKKIEAYCAKAGLPIANVSRMKPWLFVFMVTGLELQKMGVNQEGADISFFKRAKADGKPAIALEKFEDHMDFIINLGAGKESEMVISSLDDLAQSIENFPKLVAAWRSGDLAAIDEHALKDMRTEYPEIFKDLIVTRNNAWLTSIDEMLQTPETELVLVGVGHMAGPEGLIARLRERGCEIVQIQAAK
jgi:uncharacterized protein YbaP (TraB family)